jgi:hypothetical protein
VTRIAAAAKQAADKAKRALAKAKPKPKPVSAPPVSPHCVRVSGHDGPCNGLPRADCIRPKKQAEPAPVSTPAPGLVALQDEWDRSQMRRREIARGKIAEEDARRKRELLARPWYQKAWDAARNFVRGEFDI